MKEIFIALVLIASFSSLATTPQSGDSLKLSVDWDRIERGIKTGDFSCKGTCAKVSIDWKETWLTISGQSYRDQKRRNISYCISEFQKMKNIFDDIDQMESNGEITVSKAELSRSIHQSAMRSVELICENRLGKRKSNNLKMSILNSNYE